MLQSKVFPVPPYTPLLIVIIGEADGNMLYAFVKRRYHISVPRFKKVGADWAGSSFRHRGEFVFIWLRRFRNKNDFELLAHEAFHATRRIMKMAGIGRLTRDNEEAWAYLIGYIVDRVI